MTRIIIYIYMFGSCISWISILDLVLVIYIYIFDESYVNEFGNNYSQDM